MNETDTQSSAPSGCPCGGASQSATLRPMTDETAEAREAAAQAVGQFGADLASMFLERPATHKTELSADGDELVVVLKAEHGEQGRLVGKDGRMHAALRRLLMAAGRRGGFANLTYGIHEYGFVAKARPPLLFQARADWPEREVFGLWKRTLDTVLLLPAGWSAEGLFDRQGGYTDLRLTVDPREPLLWPEAVLKDALNVVFSAVGRQQGRRLFVRVVERGAQPTEKREATT